MNHKGKCRPLGSIFGPFMTRTAVESHRRPPQHPIDLPPWRMAVLQFVRIDHRGTLFCAMYTSRIETRVRGVDQQQT